MNRRQFLSAAIALAVALSPLAFATSDSAVPPNSQHSLADSHRPVAANAGDSVTRFGGKSAAPDALVSVEDYRAGGLATGSDRTFTVGQLLEGAAPAAMVTAEPEFFVDPFKDMSIEERAIRDVRVRVQHGGDVNVLLGEMYGLRVNEHSDYAVGGYDATVSPLVYKNAFLYVEKRATGNVTVIATVQPTNEGNVNNYHAEDLEAKPRVGDFFQGAQGVAMVEKVEPSEFLNNNLPLRIWSARTVHTCPSGQLSSGCFYKYNQPTSTHQGYQQVVMVAKAGWMEWRKSFNTYELLEITPAVQLTNGKLLRAGSVFAQRLKNRFSTDPNGQLNQMLSDGGTTWSSGDLGSLKAYRQR